MMDKDQNFYFLEMNTRLQVEHPVTEECTGVDLVRDMITVAAGNPLPYKQDDIQFSGAAIECRIYAEDPENNFIPSPGVITVREAPEGRNLRLDSAAYAGFEVSLHYDPMIAKLCCWDVPVLLPFPIWHVLCASIRFWELKQQFLSINVY